VRRGAAWPPVERPSTCLVVQQAVSRAGRRTAPPSRRGCRAPRVLPTTTRFGVPAASCCPGCPDAHRAFVTRPGPRSASACPASTRPVSGVRCVPSVHPSGVRAFGVRRPVSGVRCPMPGVPVRCPLVRVDVGCPVRASGMRPCRVCVRSVRTGEFLEREDAMGSHASGSAGSACHHTASATGLSAAERDLNLGPAS
jgi:hypothetical protein